MKIWKADIDGVVYWVAARSAAEALGLCVFSESVASPDDEHAVSHDNSGIEWNSFEIRAIPEAEASVTKLKGDGSPDTTMLEAMQVDPRRARVLGCSEWP